jgi:hypothetical protein
LAQTKGKLHIIFKAELTAEFVDRMEKIKKYYITDA